MPVLALIYTIIELCTAQEEPQFVPSKISCKRYRTHAAKETYELQKPQEIVVKLGLADPVA